MKYILKKGCLFLSQTCHIRLGIGIAAVEVSGKNRRGRCQPQVYIEGSVRDKVSCKETLTFFI